MRHTALLMQAHEREEAPWPIILHCAAATPWKYHVRRLDGHQWQQQWSPSDSSAFVFYFDVGVAVRCA